MNLLRLAPIGLLLLLAACRSQAAEAPPSAAAVSSGETIRIHSLPSTDEEYAVMAAAGASDKLIYTLDAPAGISKIELWIDQYTDGKLKESLSDFQSGITQPAAEYQLYFSSQENEAGNQWTLAIRSDQSVSSTCLAAPDLGPNGHVLYSTDRDDVQAGKEAVIGVLIVGDGGNGMMSSGDVQDTLSRNKDVYVLKCRID